MMRQDFYSGDGLLKYELIVCSDAHVSALFELLSQRNHSVSHRDMPSRSDHEEFVQKNPYRVWYLVKYKECYIGTVYLTYENHVGISLPSACYSKFPDVLAWIAQSHQPLVGIKSVRPSCYQINIPIGDVGLTDVLAKLGYKQVQVTYLLGNGPN